MKRRLLYVSFIGLSVYIAYTIVWWMIAPLGLAYPAFPFTAFRITTLPFFLVYLIVKHISLTIGATMLLAQKSHQTRIGGAITIVGSLVVTSILLVITIVIPPPIDWIHFPLGPDVPSIYVFNDFMYREVISKTGFVIILFIWGCAMNILIHEFRKGKERRHIGATIASLLFFAASAGYYIMTTFVQTSQYYYITHLKSLPITLGMELVGLLVAAAALVLIFIIKTQLDEPMK